MQLFVVLNGAHRKPLTLDFQPSDTIDHMWAHIEDKWGADALWCVKFVRCPLQSAVYIDPYRRRRNHFPNRTTIADWNIQKETTLHLESYRPPHNWDYPSDELLSDLGTSRAEQATIGKKAAQ